MKQFEREWTWGRLLVVLVFACDLWFEAMPSGARRVNYVRLSAYANPACPTLRVFSLVVWRLKIVWGLS